MESFILEDVESLLKIKKGDPNRLNSIKELCENNKIIPISDRKYVERLVSQYLHKEERKPIPKTERIATEKTQRDFHDKITSPIETKENKIISKSKMVNIQTPKKSSKFEFSSKNKILMAAATITLAIIVVGAAALYGGNITFENKTPEPEPTKPIGLTPPYIFLETDESSYNVADIISISGETNPIIKSEIRLTILNPTGKLIWAENVQVKNNGKFSTLVIAGGQGWENSGKYTLSVTGDSLTNKIMFDFKS